MAVMEITKTDSSSGLPWVIIPDFDSFSTSNIYHQGHRIHAAVSCDTERNEEFPSGTNVTCVEKQKSLKKITLLVPFVIPAGLKWEDMLLGC